MSQPCLLHNQLLAHALQSAHLVDEGFHDDDGHHGEQLTVLLDAVNLEDDEPLAEQVDVLRGVEQDSIKTLLLTLWKSEDDKVTKTESGELGSAVNAYIERIRADRSITPSFNTFYEYMRDDYRRELAEREIKVEKSDFNIDNMLTTMRHHDCLAVIFSDRLIHIAQIFSHVRR